MPTILDLPVYKKEDDGDHQRDKEDNIDDQLSFLSCGIRVDAFLHRKVRINVLDLTDVN